MSAHRTWRLVFKSSPSGEYIDLQEVAFLDSAGLDLSVGGVASASSEYGPAYGAAQAFDKSTATEWATVSGGVPAWLQYEHPSPVEVARVRLVNSTNAGYSPTSAAAMALFAGDEQQHRYALTLESGSFTASAVAVLSVQPYVPPTLAGTPVAGRLLQDFRTGKLASGVISDRVMFKATPSSPESPFATGRVWLLRAADGYKAWEGWSDSNGYYTATGLELGVEYIAVGIDPYRNHKATGAGPVVATEAP